MAGKKKEHNDFYAVLGLKKACSDSELRIAYKKLALKWHPDRCSSSGNSKCVEEAKKKFQAIQEAYSVLSDANKRFLYDVGVYESDDDNDENGMGDFLNEMADMMIQNKSNGKHEESFEDLQNLFKEMFQSDIQSFQTSSSSYSTSFSASSSDRYNVPNKRTSSDKSSGNFESNASQFEGFNQGAQHKDDLRREKGVGGRIPARTRSSRLGGRKQKVSSGHDVSSDN